MWHESNPLPVDLEKVSETNASAGQVMVPTDERPQEGQVAVSVELTALCSPDARPGRFSEAAHCLNEQACAHAWTISVAGLLCSSTHLFLWDFCFEFVRPPERKCDLAFCVQPLRMSGIGERVTSA